MAEDRYLDDDTRWQLVLAHDPSADGAFVYAVRTTGIYCRPSCPSRRPKRDNVVFFATAAEAERAGFRACHKCHPDVEGCSDTAIALARKLLEAADTEPTLAELGQAVGLSPQHLQRLFKRAVGLSPKAYFAALRSERVKAELRRGQAVTDALYSAGYGSSRALYEGAVSGLGMTPGAYRRGGDGVEIVYALAETSLGTAIIAATARGVCSLRFGERKQLLDELNREFPKASLREDGAAVARYVDWLTQYLAGQRPDGEQLPPLDVTATAFQRRVWQALREIPYGETRSYSQIASAIGNPKAVRAVARACATNPTAVLIPCHRVVHADGDASGYRWGRERKNVLLEGERTGSTGGARP